MSATSIAPQGASPKAVRKPMNYRWLVVLIALGIVVSVLLVYAQNQVYEPATPFLGGTGDHVHAFALDPSQPDHMYVGTHYGFFRSNDMGSQWTRLNGVGGIPGTLVATSVSISSLDGRTVYATGYNLGSGNAAGVFVSRDDGGHWRLLSTGGAHNLPDPRVLFVVAGWSTATEAYAYSLDAGLYRTVDAGAHWEQVAAPFAGQVTTFLPYRECSGQANPSACPEQFLVGTTQGLLTATNASALNFQPVPNVGGYIYTIALRRSAVPSAYVSTAQGLFHAAQLPGAFTQVTSSANGAPTLTSLVASNDASATTLIGVTRDNVVERSSDGGLTWNTVSTDLLSRHVSQLQAGLRAATGSNTPQWAGGQNFFLTLLQAPAGNAPDIFVAISFPVQIFHGTVQGKDWSDLSDSG